MIAVLFQLLKIQHARSRRFPTFQLRLHGRGTCWTRYCSDKSNPQSPRRLIDTKATRTPPCKLLFSERNITIGTGERNIVCQDRNHIPALTGPIFRTKGGERNVAIMPMMTAVARNPAIRGVENSVYCDRKVIIDPYINH